MTGRPVDDAMGVVGTERKSAVGQLSGLALLPSVIGNRLLAVPDVQNVGKAGFSGGDGLGIC